MTHNVSIKNEYPGMVSPLRSNDTGGRVAVVEEVEGQRLQQAHNDVSRNCVVAEEMYT